MSWSISEVQYRYYPMVGSDQPAFEMVSKQKQKEALNFIFDKLYELPDWYVNPQLEKLTQAEKRGRNRLPDVHRSHAVAPRTDRAHGNQCQIDA